ncbi:RNA-binding protein rnp24 [Fulvia fulva]|uniref:RNA-binding protein rnp24 n=1 Tax=Passalora fulva TaxID=5499 RepID=A0A9Q8LHE4_PASFU|nr:RNA-binding protein rnp24 [Fulvia fulva]KAK4626321.1 RNA-binding protein rnp24 [Fulvia fulva]KAK4628291.1 RNA-binding protein rnp24 [Fulvia fulva]UJO16673.1 RNA-binding protein rnp24 [Fulvia fulva]WPV13221.1 RNA-binding protein rnp24 [Fulvia fulva]WPV28611.1 RNA-binding protein rnp24 [Fulvia fulva]
MSSSPQVEKKRKRDIKSEDELEIDVNLPEPPSKKAKRKEKKSKTKKPAEEPALNPARAAQIQDEEGDNKPKSKSAEPAKRSDYGIWIGNLPFTATKESLRDFLLREGGISAEDVTRVHMPTNDQKQNKGFAYVDFTTPAVLQIALGLSERLSGGRKVLIKNANNFEGRPEKPKVEKGVAADGSINGKEPSKRVFVGNLSFDITKDELSEHFAQAGTVEDVFLATFEDSGKCKGFGWVTFADIESATNAVKGFVWKESDVKESDVEDDESDDDEEGKKKPKRKNHKPRKWFINRYNGRTMRCEFAEDAQTRYQKRYGKGGPKEQRSAAPNGEGDAVAGGEESIESLAREAASARENAPRKQKNDKYKKMGKDERQEVRRKKFDARTKAPGKALAQAPRASAAIVAGAGSKMTFDE